MVGITRDVVGNSAGGQFVALEGIDGSGKTSALTAAAEVLRGQGWPVAVVEKQTLELDSPYLQRHMRDLRELIWDHPADDPYLELGDLHWVYLQAAWYSAVATCVVQPLLQAGKVVLTDTWAGKFLAKLRMRPGVDFEHARGMFSRLPVPDVVIRLVIDPVLAASRKAGFSVSEAGNHEGRVELSLTGFVEYQSRLSAVLDEFGDALGWVPLEVTTLTVPQVGQAVVDLIHDHRASGIASAATGKRGNNVPEGL